jgi:hypothetical protein
MKFIKKHFLNNLILVTGTHTSGKSMVSPIVASLSNVEILRKIYYLDQLSILYNFKKINLEVARFFGQHILDLSYYEQLIGRNLNFRVEDETSVYQSKNPNLYKKRIVSQRGAKVLAYHDKIGTHMLLDAHDGIWFYKFWKNLQIKNLKIINIHRNPIDIVNSWINSDYGLAEKQILCQIPLISKNNKVKPFYLYNNFRANNLINKTEVIIDMVDECVRKEISIYKRIKDKKKILRINFDDFAKNTNFNINKICYFLNLKKTLFTKKIMKKENLPRILHKLERTEKLKKIKSKVSEKKFKKLLNLEMFYNNNN